MPEEIAQTDGAGGVETVVNPPASTETFINTDGTFKEGWQGKYIPAEVQERNQMLWSGMHSMSDLVHQINNQDQTISRQGKGIFPPGENANETEVKAFHKAIGVPDTPDGYTLTVPKEVEKYYQDQELMNEAKTAFHKLGLTPKQFVGVMALDAARMQRADAEMKANPMAYYEEALEAALPIMKAEAEKALRLKWGQAYDARLQLANAAIAENTQEGEERDLLLERIGNDPVVADFIATIQNKHHTESHGIDVTLGGGSKYMNVDQQIQAMMKDPNYIDGKTNPAEHKRLVDEVNKLLSQKTGGKILE